MTSRPLSFAYGWQLLILVLVLVALATLFGTFRPSPDRGSAQPAPTPPQASIEPLQLIQEFRNVTDLPLEGPTGFELSEVAGGFEQPRVLANDARGRLLISDQRGGDVVALVPLDLGWPLADNAVILELARGLSQPHGLVFVDDTTLLIAEEHQITEWRYDLETPAATFAKKLLDLPADGGHRSRTLQKGSDGKIYVTIGSSCNVCAEDDGRRAAMYRFNPDGSDFELWASGLRNTVFFVPNPETGDFWGNDMGRDLLGDNLPPDELNSIPAGDREPPGDYGWPRCYGANVHDIDFDKSVYKVAPCAEPTIHGTRYDYPAHVAPLGLRFIPPGIGWPEEWVGDLLVAWHGSWNSSTPVGYKIVRLELDADQQVVAVHDFMTEFLDNGQLVGRPVDLLFVGSDLLVSDDGRGSIFRLRPVST